MGELRMYNPLDYQNLTVNLVRELMSRGPVPLPLAEPVKGPGVYALFYNGDFKPYAKICSRDASRPIYVGKAVLPGARKGGGENLPAGAPLFGRIKEHVQSIRSANNLKVAHFSCRYLVVVPLWITMAERFLLEHY
ncbi:MAG TPA: Eco29kI family restriction endonuclease, partial [Candidatus Methylacidiphilales bacterium]|nr:Eco29kI family restriction endonuclease [Candidatus Methylacidiphilales bacterium]